MLPADDGRVPPARLWVPDGGRKRRCERGGGGEQMNDVSPRRAEHARNVSRLPVSPAARDLFVGREAELGGLVRALDRAIAHDGGLVLLVGEPGIGKTRIARELAF